MGDIHWLIEKQGIEAARKQALTARDRAAVEAAYQVLTDEQERTGYTYSGFALTSLPHKPTSEQAWKRVGHNLTMVIQAGVDADAQPIGLPYGSYARFILLYLQSQAIRSRSREVELGRSMHIWLGRMGFSIGGWTYKQAKEQARRISGCTLRFFAEKSGAEIMRKGGFVDGSITMTDTPEQGALWQDKVFLNEHFYRALVDHPVPVSETALQAIGARSLALDVYIWLAYRLHALKADTTVSWTALRTQFGTGVHRMNHFRSGFLDALQVALAAYPAARVSVDAAGLTLHPSRPPIAKA